VKIPHLGTNIVKIFFHPTLYMVYSKNKNKTLQISKYPLVLHPNPLVRAIGQVEFCSCPENKDANYKQPQLQKEEKPAHKCYIIFTCTLSLPFTYKTTYYISWINQSCSWPELYYKCANSSLSWRHWGVHWYRTVPCTLSTLIQDCPMHFVNTDTGLFHALCQHWYRTVPCTLSTLIQDCSMHFVNTDTGLYHALCQHWYRTVPCTLSTLIQDCPMHSVKNEIEKGECKKSICFFIQ